MLRAARGGRGGTMGKASLAALRGGFSHGCRLLTGRTATSVRGRWDGRPKGGFGWLRFASGSALSCSAGGLGATTWLGGRPSRPRARTSLAAASLGEAYWQSGSRSYSSLSWSPFLDLWALADGVGFVTDYGKRRLGASAAGPESSHSSAGRRPVAEEEEEEGAGGIEEASTVAEQLRSVMRLVPSAVIVCTSTHGAVPRAMTMSSFTSLTLSPRTLVTFNIATPSRTLEAISWSGAFNIHVLAGNAAGAATADRFAHGNTDGIFDGLQGIGCRRGEEEEAAAAAAGEGGAGEAAPLLQGEGVLRVLRCRLFAEGAAKGLFRVMDRVIVVGEVVEVVAAAGSERRADFGLSYANRRYRGVGGALG